MPAGRAFRWASGWTGLALAALLGCADRPVVPTASTSALEARSADPPPIRAVTLDARRRPSEAALDEIAQLGATHVAVIPFGWMSGTDVPAVQLRTDPDWYAESDAGIRDLHARLARRGIGLILKPQLWIRGGGWSAEVAFEQEAHWEAWEADYRRFALHYARLAADLEADRRPRSRGVFVLATELAAAMQQREAFWRTLIAEVRAVYPGRLTVAANWYGDADVLPFWDALDLVGVQAYYPVSDEHTPSADDLESGWREIAGQLRALHEASGKPVLLTELGYRSVDGAAAEPWRWPERGETGEPAYALQADLYDAALGTLWALPFVEGVVLWKAHPEPSAERHRLDFTWQDKPAESVIARRFLAERPLRGD